MQLEHRRELAEQLGDALSQVDPQELVGLEALDQSALQGDLAICRVRVIEPGR
jgi:hypothetical protein